MADNLLAPKRIVLFADGTGSAFTLQETNVWRLYQALDKTGDDPTRMPQIARYIPGVGTSANVLIRLLDGATGFGVPSNVRHLYRFLCLNWSPGDEIFVFGFSRGAFTVRTLAGMIRMQGLIPREITENGVTRLLTGPEMDRAVMGAWLAYRAETAPLWGKDGRLKMNPVIEGLRRLRDGFVRVKRIALGQMAQAVVKAQQPEGWRRGEVPIQLMGVFDTVEAYGVPSDDLRNMINWWIWPIVFRNHQCSPIVKEVRHALALDDTRLTFHPVRFDMTPYPEGPTPAVKEVWFAGMHSDVGGGFPDDACAMAALSWMAAEAKALHLRFHDAALAAHEWRRFDAAAINESRRGFGHLYRYAPRDRLESEGTGAAPVVHASVLAKMQRGVDGYFPLKLPETMEVEGAAEPHGLVRDAGVARRVARLVGWRKATNVVTILCLVGLVVIALTPLWQPHVPPPDPPLLALMKTVMGQVVPSFGARIIDAFQAHWQIALTLLGLVLAIHLVNQQLTAAIRDTARHLWRPLQPPGQGG